MNSETEILSVPLTAVASADSNRRTLPTIVGLAIPLGFTAWRVATLGYTSYASLAHQPAPQALAGFKLTIMYELWVMVVVLAAVVVFWERKSIDSIGLKTPSIVDLSWAVCTALLATPLALLMMGVVVFAVAGSPQLGTIHGADSIAALPVGVRIFMAITEPIFEGFVFRAYLFERAESLSGNTWLAGALSCTASSLMHGGWIMGLMLLPMGALWTAFYAWRRNLPASIFLHLLVMLCGLFLVPMISVRH